MLYHYMSTSLKKCEFLGIGLPGLEGGGGETRPKFVVDFYKLIFTWRT